VAYELTYFLAAGVQMVLVLFTSAMIAETLPREGDGPVFTTALPAGGGGLGYGPLLRDRSFLMIWGLYILIQIANSMVFVLLGVYVKENYAISENRFGLIIGVNALMVVFFQYAVTRISSRHAPLHAITAGAVFQAVGLGLFAISRGFAAFLGGMVVFTVGELLLVPTATALVANIAPPHMRARYMGVFSLSFRVGSGIGPVVGGLLNDNIAPVATWYGAMVFCGIAVAGFGLLSRRTARPAVQRQAGSPL
jgi:predicted MFS family arabinose efflux permease